MARTFATYLVVALAFASPARSGGAGAPTLAIGDRAPAIDIAHWIKGVEMDARGAFTPLTTFGDGKIYVLEFWATWCVPCVGGMSHLSKLQERYAEDDVTIIGLSDETLPKVTSFLFETDEGDGKIQNERCRYVLATDPDRSVQRDYFRAAGQTGIPCAFVIGRSGHVEWIGHPTSLDEPLQAIVAGAWDRTAYKETFAREQAEKRFLREAGARLRAATKARDWDACIAVLDGLLARRPDDAGLQWNKFKLLVGPAGKPDEAYAMSDDLLRTAWTSARMLNRIAWSIVDDQDVVRRDLDLALRAAKRANALSASRDPAVLDTMARVHFESGDLAAALRWQRLAARHAGAGSMGEAIRAVLEKYERAAANRAAAPSHDRR